MFGLACSHAQDTFILIQDYIYNEAQPGTAGRLADRGVEGVALNLPQPGAGMVDEGRAMRIGDKRFAGSAELSRLNGRGTRSRASATKWPTPRRPSCCSTWFSAMARLTTRPPN